VAPFDRPYTTFYWSAVVNIAFVPFLGYLTLNSIVTLKSGLEVTHGHSKWYHSKVGCGFLFAFHSNYGSILHQFRDKARYWSQILIFSYPLHSAPPLGVSPTECCHPVWCRKTRMVGLPDGEKNFEDICNRLHTIPACDGRTDGQTDKYLATA